MKILPLLAAVLLGGCSQTAAPSQPVCAGTGPFQAVVYLEQDGREGRGILRREEGELSLLLEEPREVDGLSFVQKEGEGLTLAMGELSFSLPPDSLPACAPFRMMEEALEQAALVPLEQQEDGSLAAKGSCSAGEFVLWAKEDGKFLRLEVSAESFTVEFENVQFSP